MGELILCSHPIAAMPYYIDNISLNVYSLEELCYYIENHLYLIEADFMSEELCLWIGQELDEKDLARVFPCSLSWLPKVTTKGILRSVA